ncbi:similar to Saccharomyces cerevisiae YDR218C SPR28 Sporulation-specific homolog of the yeast CDC3/10/11/12 family of bud neck microfilament genes [Maudiozyma barnettii]|uniref:Similar to Saccharomyces cerevisiae YDR218C SPR28 Sporulation-specific homolog of the yeast CDC3/10/11/12 family of bud neck microfilament genes n=1 Tax=Maudiozyma barnettii TaxID=61262 RepID=A0A8H2VG97_9SACH|nr:septin SPR28 [Kazachstania barnettii]CAB4255020.1 similar to Saccharomyces cerevisiae YDR218C SPR28 Sporulation-specific homolog of the yeast CDC3/10/11/12 family of bud neck microfilament genes [Kazachstania barnettii]CAD1783291.1 similar to Saccharomyces cerevisiae YDR218C SPR28 Sporulation-specific homolog of the yeast CDC3/10/11/12 family of bud neck microfilament genes [Kazachstania barnettii]
MRTAEELRRRKNSKQVIYFNLLLLGPPGIGKHTFLENLVNNNVESEVVRLNSENNGHIVPHGPIFERSIVKIRNELTSSILLNVTSCDTVNQLNNSSAPKRIREHIEAQYNSFLNDEFKVLRNQEYNRTSDKRLHACIFFIDGNAKELQMLEIDILSEISSLINIILVIGKADRFNDEEVDIIKKRVNVDIKNNNIKVFDFNDDFLDDIFEESEHKLIKDFQPFAVILGNKLSEDSNELYRDNICSKIMVDDIRSSNFSFLKGIILGSHIQELQSSTNNYIYEKFRTRRLIEKQNEINIKKDVKEGDSIEPTKEFSSSPALFRVNPSPTDIVLTPDCEVVVGKELNEKNRIIEAYQKKIDDLEKILQNSNDSSPTTKVTLCDLERAI